MSSKHPLANQVGYKERIDAHKFWAALWATIAKVEQERMVGENFLSARKEIETMIQRCMERSLRHHREAEAIRCRGHK